MRKLAKLTKLKVKKIKNSVKFGTCDTESTSTQKHDYRVGSITYKFRNILKTETFWSFKEMFNFIYVNKIKLIYVFNLNYDCTHFFNLLYSNDPDFSVLIDWQMIEIASGSRELGLIIKKGKDIICKVKDFYPYILSSLDKASETYNLKTRKYRVDFNNCSNQEIQKHVNNDTVMLYELIEIYRQNLIKTDNFDILDNNIYSIASLAMSLFRQNYLKADLENSYISQVFTNGKIYYEIDEENYNKTRKSYKGGFCFNTDQRLHFRTIIIDINSSYPFQCTKIKFPIGRLHLTTDYDEFLEKTSEIPGFCKVGLYCSDSYLVGIRQNKLELEKGYVLDWITSYELEYAVEEGCSVCKFEEGIYFDEYDETESLKNYMLDNYNTKKKAIDKIIKEIAKSKLNHLTGKFGQKMKQERVVFEMLKGQEDIEEDFVEVQPFAQNLITKTKQESISIKTFMFVSWISLITAKARIQLLKMFKKVNGFYCDTDSVHFERENMIFVNSDEMGKELGQWKIESENEYERCLAAKLYAFKRETEFALKENENLYEVKAKGVPFMLFSSIYYDIMNFNKIKVVSDRILSHRGAFVRKDGLLSRDGLFGAISTQKISLEPKIKEIVMCYDF